MMKILCMGEPLFRYSTKKGERFEKLNFDLNIGGSETNIAVNLARMGMHTSLFTKLPSHQLGEAVIRFLHYQGVGLIISSETMAESAVTIWKWAVVIGRVRSYMTGPMRVLRH